VTIITNKKTFMLNCDIELTFSVFENKLLFVHSQFMSGQYIMSRIGVIITDPLNSAKVAFISTDFGLSDDYQSYYFKIKEYEELIRYFKGLGYPAPDS